MKLKTLFGLALACTLGGLAASAPAQTRVTFKAAKAGTSYYQMAVQIAETVRQASDGTVSITVEESQGSVQNVKEAPLRGANYLFTSPPALVAKAVAGEKPFAPKDEAFGKVRALFPIPSLTMHYVVRADAGIERFADLAGKSFVIGKGSFGAREAKANFKAFGLEGKLEIIDIELSGAGSAMKNGQVDGFATAGSWPAPNVVEVAATMPVRLLSMSEEQVAATGRTRLVIPAGTYPGVDYDVITTSLPVITYAMADMDEDTAYRLTRGFWEGRTAMAAGSPWWNGVAPDLLDHVRVPLHPGALRYYKEAGIPLPDAAR